MLRCWSVQCFRCRRRASPTPAAAAVWPVCYADVAAKPDNPKRPGETQGETPKLDASRNREPRPRAETRRRELAIRLASRFSDRRDDSDLRLQAHVAMYMYVVWAASKGGP